MLRLSQQMEKDYHSFLNYPLNAILPGIVVPQQSVNPTSRDPASSIVFKDHNMPGVRLSDADNGRVQGLQNGHQPFMVANDGEQFQLCIHVRPNFNLPIRVGNTDLVHWQWPGYPPWTKALSFQNTPFSTNNVPLDVLARLVAKTMKQFFSVCMLSSRGIQLTGVAVGHDKARSWLFRIKHRLVDLESQFRLIGFSGIAPCFSRHLAACAVSCSLKVFGPFPQSIPLGLVKKHVLDFRLQLVIKLMLFSYL